MVNPFLMCAKFLNKFMLNTWQRLTGVSLYHLF